MPQTATATQTPSDLTDPKIGHYGEETHEAVTRYVVVEVNGNLYGMPTDATVELMSSSMTQVTRVPHSPRFITGVINHRGTIIPVIDSRTLLGFAHRGSEVQRLEKLFAELRAEHEQWLADLCASIEHDTPLDRGADPKNCGFGRWFRSVMDGTAKVCAEPLREPVVHSLVERLEIPHTQIHAVARQASELSKNGQRDKALELIERTRSTEFVLMCELFDQVLRAVGAHYESMLVITEVGAQKAAIAVDGVSFVADCKDEDIEPLPDTAENTEFLSGLVHQDDGSYILVADLANIYSTAGVTG